MHMGHLKIDRMMSLLSKIIFSQETIIFRGELGLIMGKGPKHSNAKSRNNGIFKVAGQNFKNEKKGKPKEVTQKLKLISKRNNEKVTDLDATLRNLQKQSVVSGKSLAEGKISEEKPKIIPATKKTEIVNDQEMDDLAESILKY